MFLKALSGVSVVFGLGDLNSSLLGVEEETLQGCNPTLCLSRTPLCYPPFPATWQLEHTLLTLEMI